MILADTSVWIDFLNKGDAFFAHLLEKQLVTIHPFVIGELAVGNFKDRSAQLIQLSRLPISEEAADKEVLELIERHQLFGIGIGYVDAHLLTAAAIAGSEFWTHDKRLHRVAVKLKLAQIH
jgi:predicted nucleic acid-binding protein